MLSATNSENGLSRICQNSKAWGDKSTFDTTTIGAQYHFKKKTRMNVEYAMRDLESDTKAINNNLKDVKDRFAIQVTYIFKIKEHNYKVTTEL